MGLLDLFKDLLGSAGVTELVEATGVGDHLDTLADITDQPAEVLGSVAELPDVANPLVEGP